MNRRGFCLVSLTLLAACKGEGDAALDPVWGKQPCEHCKMLVDDRRSAAQAVVAGDRFYFDDVGCLVAWLSESKRDGRVWVRTEAGSGWIDARDARFVSGQKTPMDFGYVPSAAGDLDWGKVNEGVLARLSKGGAP